MSLHVESHGSGAPLLLIHGWGMHGGIWGSVVPHLAQRSRVHCVDLPGYGYAKVPEQMRAGWKRLIEDFLKRGQPISLAMQLIDSRQEPTPLDLMMMDWLEYYEVPLTI